MVFIFSGNIFGFYNDADINGVELMVNNRPFTNITANTEVSFSKRWQFCFGLYVIQLAAL